MWTTITVIAGLATAITHSSNPAVRYACIPLAITGPWLAAVDLDVMRIPNRVLAPTGALTVAVVVATVGLTPEGPSIAILAALGGVLAGGLFAGLHFATRGNIGFGDVKLAAVIGIAIGPLGLNTVWAALLAGSVIAFIWAKTTKRVGPVPYGPWLLLGAASVSLTPQLAAGIQPY